MFAEVIFRCQTKNNKIIKVTREEDYLFYSFGAKGKEEINIKQKISDKSILLGSNASGYIYSSIIFKRGSYQYMVTALSDINVPSDKTFTGVDVSSEEKGEILSLKCRNDTIYDNIESLSKVLYPITLKTQV